MIIIKSADLLVWFKFIYHSRYTCVATDTQQVASFYAAIKYALEIYIYSLYFQNLLISKGTRELYVNRVLS